MTLSNSTRHELKCAACGAPISKLKSLPKNHVQDGFTTRGKKGYREFQPRTPAHHQGKKKAKKKKKNRGLTYYLMEAAEEVFDIFD